MSHAIEIGNSVYEQSIHIGYSDINAKGQLKIASILNFLQDIASEHAAEMGLSGFDLATQGFAWVIARYHINVNSNPKWREDLHAATYRRSYKNLFEIRELTVGKPGEEPSIFARSAWVMVKKGNGRPVRLSRFMPEELLSRDTEDHNEFFNDLRQPLRTDFELPFKIRMHDLDLNQHVNNAIYVEWAAETVPEDVLSLYRPGIIDVSFHKESFYGDAILSVAELETSAQKVCSYHSIFKADRKTELARINIDWHPMEG